MLLQLNPAIPVYVVKNPDEPLSPEGNALAHIIIDNGYESNLQWVCFMNNSTQCWTVENKFIRGQKNITLGRIPPVKGD